MNAPTRTIETPQSKTKVDLREWITGRQAEYIQEPILNSVKLGAENIAGALPEMSVKSIDAREAVTESAHREIEVYVAKVIITNQDGSTSERTNPVDCLEAILDLPEDDTAFVQSEIANVKADAKKK